MSASPKSPGVRPECQFDLHSMCKVGDVVTSYGDVAFTVRCSCPCHRTPAEETS